MEGMVLDRRKDAKFDMTKCIICQKGGLLVSTENGHTAIMDAAKVRGDVVL